MSFSTKLSDSFGKVLDRSPFTVVDGLVKAQTVTRGNNIVFGRILKDANVSELIYIGKILESAVGKSYLGYDAWLDITFPHVVYITGTRGTGKSFDLGVIAEGISALNEPSLVQNGVTPLTSIIIDTQSQFWTLRFSPTDDIPANQEQRRELKRWNIKPNSLERTNVWVPPRATKFLGDEKEIRIRPADVTHEEWCALLGQEVYSPQGHILGKTLDAVGVAVFGLRDIISYISNDLNWVGIADSSRNALVYKLEDLEKTGLFDVNGIQIKDFLQPRTCNVLMLRDLRNEDKSLLTAVIARQLFTVMGDYHNKRKVARFFGKADNVDELPSRVWLFIDEAHVIAPREGPSPARSALVEYVKRGRDAGLSLVMATQQPSAVDDRILSQVNISFNHRLTFQSDISAAASRIPTKLVGELKMAGTTVSDFGDMLRTLEAGQCFIGDHCTSRAVIMQVRPRVTAHGGYSPI
jgi:hypothetical protein